MTSSSIFAIAQNPEKTTWNTTTNNYENVIIPSLFPSEKALILKTTELGIIPIFRKENVFVAFAGSGYFEDIVYQTLVEDNSLQNEISIVLPLSNVITNLKNFFQEVNQEIKDFRKTEDGRLEEISYE